jgi:hypothetical protein
MSMAAWQIKNRLRDDQFMVTDAVPEAVLTPPQYTLGLEALKFPCSVCPGPGAWPKLPAPDPEMASSTMSPGVEATVRSVEPEVAPVIVAV